MQTNGQQGTIVENKKANHGADGAIEHIVVVGGGTAGWLSANHLLKQLGKRNIRITLIESPDIATVGVGEGTVPMMRQTLQELGIRETEFIQRCDVTFKQGIKFIDWLDNPDDSLANADKPYYHHIFDYPLIHEFSDLTEHYLSGHAPKQTSFVDAVAFQGKVCDQHRAPKDITTPEYQGQLHYAYHLDAGKFSELLKEHAIKQGVHHVKANVTDVKLAKSGDIEALETDCAGVISAQFFVDCSGFRSLLLGQALGVDFIDKSDVLFVDKAVVAQIAYPEGHQDIPSYTLSTAQKHGWIWDIGLQSRRGVGHVYSSRYCSEQEAKATLIDYINAGVHDAQTEIKLRTIDMKIGYREKFWSRNCAAIGLSQGFVEPLEATGLLVFDATAKLLASQFPANRSHMDIVAKQFNSRVNESWLRVIDFIKLHYCLSRRDDSEFWRANRDPSSCPQSLQDRLVLWRHQAPSAYDFASRFEIFNLENYLYVLYGMEFDSQVPNNSDLEQNKAQAQAFFARVAEHGNTLTTQMPDHAELLNKINKFGLQTR